MDANTGIVIGNNGTILKTVNGGTNWTTIYYGKENLMSVYFDVNNTVYIVSDKGTILKSMNRDFTWWNILPQRLNCLPGNVEAIQKTVKGDINWKTIYNGAPDPCSYYFNSIYFADANSGYVLGNCGNIFKTVDGGATWKLSPSGLDVGLLKSVYFTDANTGYVVGRFNYGCQMSCNNLSIMLKTTNAGESWTSLSAVSSLQLNSVYFTDTNSGYIVGERGTILKTINGGGLVSSAKTQTIESTFTIYPNPATNKISIETNSNLQGETTICIYNMNGALLQQKKFQGQHLIELDVSTLAKGIYLVKIQTNKGIETKKLVVQ